MEIKPKKTEEDYYLSLEKLETVFDAKPGTKENDELEVLGILIDNYENVHYRFELLDPIEAIKFRMEKMGYNQTDLANIIGLKSRASEILNLKRKLTLELIRKIHSSLKIPTDVLIQTY